MSRSLLLFGISLFALYTASVAAPIALNPAHQMANQGVPAVQVPIQRPAHQGPVTPSSGTTIIQPPPSQGEYTKLEGFDSVGYYHHKGTKYIGQKPTEDCADICLKEKDCTGYIEGPIEIMDPYQRAGTNKFFMVACWTKVTYKGEADISYATVDDPTWPGIK